MYLDLILEGMGEFTPDWSIWQCQRDQTESDASIGRIPKLNHVLRMSKSVQSIREMTVVASMWHNYGIKQRQQLDFAEKTPEENSVPFSGCR